MKTPDGREFEESGESPLQAAGAMALALMGIVGRAVGKVVMTVWRLAGALDSALWRALKLIFRKLFHGFLIAAGWSGEALGDLIRWLPSRTGRALSSLFAAFLVVAGLWVIDELRASPQLLANPDQREVAPIDEQDPILARIGGRYIHLSEVVSAARASGALRDGEIMEKESAFERNFVEEYVQQRLLADAARREGMARDNSIRRKMGAAQDRILAAAYMEEQLKGVVTPEAIKGLYDAQAGVMRLGDEVRARHILVKTVAEALEIKTLLVGGAEFAAVAREKSLDAPTAVRGGEMGYFTKDMVTPGFAKAAFGTPSGKIAEPFKSEFGWHIIEVLDRRPTSSVPFEEVENGIREFLTFRTIDSTVQQLVADSDVIYFEPEPERAAIAPSPISIESDAPAPGDGEG